MLLMAMPVAISQSAKQVAAVPDDHTKHLGVAGELLQQQHQQHQHHYYLYSVPRDKD